MEHLLQLPVLVLNATYEPEIGQIVRPTASEHLPDRVSNHRVLLALDHERLERLGLET